VEWEAPTTQADLLTTLEAWGFTCAQPSRLCTELQDMADFHAELEKRRDGLSFDIDGVVYKVNGLATRATLGRNARAPRWAFPPLPRESM
jgi:DNA ligase (NAD+)